MHAWRPSQASFPHHKRLLCLSRLSALAAGTGSEAAAQAKAAELQLLSVQSRLHDLARAEGLPLPRGSEAPSQVCFCNAWRFSYDL